MKTYLNTEILRVKQILAAIGGKVGYQHLFTLENPFKYVLVPTGMEYMLISFKDWRTRPFEGTPIFLVDQPTPLMVMELERYLMPCVETDIKFNDYMTPSDQSEPVFPIKGRNYRKTYRGKGGHTHTDRPMVR